MPFLGRRVACTHAYMYMKCTCMAYVYIEFGVFVKFLKSAFYSLQFTVYEYSKSESESGVIHAVMHMHKYSAAPV